MGGQQGEGLRARTELLAFAYFAAPAEGHVTPIDKDAARKGGEVAAMPKSGILELYTEAYSALPEPLRARLPLPEKLPELTEEEVRNGLFPQHIRRCVDPPSSGLPDQRTR